MYKVNKFETKKGPVSIIRVERDNMNVSFLDYGAAIYELETKDSNGVFKNNVLKFQTLEDYFVNDPFLNATVGPLSGRTKDATFVLNNERYQLDKNFKDSANLHSGKDTLSFKYFDYSVEEDHEKTVVTFTHTADYESNFPGTQVFTIIYTIKNTDLLIEFKATTDRDTVVNLTNHAYFNLTGSADSSILDHQLWINASKCLVVDEVFVPKGVKATTDTYLDFTTPKPVKEDWINYKDELPELGIDHQLLVDTVGFEYKQVALFDPSTKTTLEVYTTYPVVVLYTHNHFSDNLFDNGKMELHRGICFETQYESNGINVDGFNDSILRKDETYYEKTLFRFTVKES